MPGPLYWVGGQWVVNPSDGLVPLNAPPHMALRAPSGQIVEVDGGAAPTLVAFREIMRGPQGNQGPPGTGTAAIISDRIAAQPLSGHRVVRTLPNGTVSYADRSVPGHADSVLGLTIGAAAAGARVDVMSSGFITESSWTWIPNQPLWLGSTGYLTQARPVSGSMLAVGFAETATTIFIRIGQPIELISG